MSAGNNTLPVKSTGKDESSGSTGRKNAAAKPQEPVLKCPRCDSSNTKFCYYNNYSLTQPRHFCKTCRRYWTRGGALRNVPIGGGCRKSKKIKSCNSRLSGDSIGPSDVSGFKLFQGASPATMDVQLGGFNNYFPRLDYPNSSALFNQFSSLGDVSNPCFSLDPSGSSTSPVMGFNFPLPSSLKQQGEIGGSSLNVNGNLTSSIETLSSINQDLHWKLQQQRLAMLFVDDSRKESCVSSVNLEHQPEALLELAKQDASGIGSSTKRGTSANLSTEWFFDNSYAPVSPIPPNGNVDINANEASWSNMNQYDAFP